MAPSTKSLRRAHSASKRLSTSDGLVPETLPSWSTDSRASAEVDARNFGRGSPLVATLRDRSPHPLPLAIEPGQENELLVSGRPGTQTERDATWGMVTPATPNGTGQRVNPPSKVLSGNPITKGVNSVIDGHPGADSEDAGSDGHVVVELTRFPMNAEPFVSAEKAAAFLGIARRHLLALARAGIAGAYALDPECERRTWIFRLTELAAAIEARKPPGAAGHTQPAYANQARMRSAVSRA